MLASQGVSKSVSQSINRSVMADWLTEWSSEYLPQLNGCLANRLCCCNLLTGPSDYFTCMFVISEYFRQVFEVNVDSSLCVQLSLVKNSLMWIFSPRKLIKQAVTSVQADGALMGPSQILQIVVISGVIRETAYVTFVNYRSCRMSYWMSGNFIASVYQRLLNILIMFYFTSGRNLKGFARIVRVIRVILLDAFLKTTFFVSSLSRKQINKDFHSLRKEDAFVACVKVESSS